MNKTTPTLIRSIVVKMLLGIVAIFVFVGLPKPSSAQCLQNSFRPGRIFKTTGIQDLDVRFNQEGTLIHSVFGVAPNMFIFDDGGSPNAYATPQDTAPGYTGTVYFGLTLIRTELWNMNKGGYAVAGIMAHEFAHILQNEKGSGLSSKGRELHADFMAGYYLGRKSYLAPTNIQAFAVSLYEKGDYAFWNPNHHGTPQERVNAMVLGFRSSSLSLDDAYSRGEDLFSSGSARTNSREDREEEERPTKVSFTIRVAPLVPGKFATNITVYLDGNEVGQLSNTESPYEIEISDVTPGRHTYRIHAPIFTVDQFGNLIRAGLVTGNGTITVQEGDTFQVRADGNVATLYKVR
jgi:hypothetical protein